VEEEDDEDIQYDSDNSSSNKVNQFQKDNVLKEE
jgi:hypothetical protein